MRRFLVLTILLSGCAYTHTPNLSSPPVDKVKYQADLNACRQEGRERVIAASNPTEARAATAFGVLGAAVTHNYRPNENSDYRKNAMEIADECMKTKGYPVVE